MKKLYVLGLVVALGVLAFMCANVKSASAQFIDEQAGQALVAEIVEE